MSKKFVNFLNLWNDSKFDLAGTILKRAMNVKHRAALYSVWCLGQSGGYCSPVSATQTDGVINGK